MQYSKSAHSIYYTRYHLVFATRYRRKVVKQGMGAYIKGILRKSFQRAHPEIEILEVNTDEDHIHILASIAPKLAVSDAARLLKGYSARAMRKRFRFLNKVYYGSDGIWSDGYFVSTVGTDEKTIRRYIKYQGKVDGGQARLEL